ncbi:MAG: UDP-2-acetamido-3-amino-2,3-dideoxy-glucuronate N-acetyltransferase [Candidatus Azotimanducaceae bacterium]|jgi:UDP-2-acetamido-3-amino-2,3-dideoxy-glucuronate N-acetyltransferase
MMNKDNFFVHESSYIDDDVEIGEGTKIWHFCHVLSGARIGKNCNFGQNVSIAGQTNIGDNVKVQNNVSIYEGLTIEDDVFLGPSCVLTNVSNPRSQVQRKSLYEETLLRQGCSIGANATIVCGVTVGRYAFVAAGAVVATDVPDYALMVGVPARQKGWMSRHGHALKQVDGEDLMICPESGLKYRLFSSADSDSSQTLKCIDFDEDVPLPKALSSGTKDYQQFKNAK